MSTNQDNPAGDALPFGLRKIFAHNEVIFAVGVATVLATLLIPLPTFILDVLLSCSIAVAIATMTVVLSARDSLEFSTFPSLLLFVTLFRLSLNVASTRLILQQGDAGRIIQTFGQFVAGGNLVIGLVVFLILVVIQFVVITKGSERISEVSARFNLDAMPGKQMAIDADLNAGLIREDEARQRRETIVRESEFYGAMDGASKFIRGDAVAALIITAINLIGGIAIGMGQGLSASASVSKYSILAVGDGLVSQIPALIISTSAGFLISKTSTQSNLSYDLMRQMLFRSKPIGIAAGLFCAMALVPGFPKIPFLLLGAGAGWAAYKMARDQAPTPADKAKAKADDADGETPEDDTPLEHLLDVDRIAIQVGPRLIRTVDPRRKNSLSQRIGPLRRKFAQQYGMILPLVRLRDNVTLDPTAYEIRLNGHVISTGQLEPEMFLAMDPGTVQTPVDGKATHEPVFNLPALWIAAEAKERAELAGYTVVDPESVLITHLSETLRRHCHELLNRDDVQVLVDRLRERQPTLVGGVVPEVVSLGLLHRVLQNLLRDGIPVRDLAQILETLGDYASRTRDVTLLTEAVRKALVRTITEQHTDASGKILAIVLEPSLEHELRQSLQTEGDSQTLAITPEVATEVSQRAAEAWRVAMEYGFDRAVLLCDSRLRPHLAGMLARPLPQLPLLAYDEVATGTDIESVGTISIGGAGEGTSPELAGVGTGASAGGGAGGPDTD